MPAHALVRGAVLDTALHGTADRFDGFGDQDGSGSEQYLSWVASIQNEEWQRLKPKAVQALKRLIAADSELRVLWEETDCFCQWRDIYTHMIERLQS